MDPLDGNLDTIFLKGLIVTYNGYNPRGYTTKDWSDLVDEGWKPLMRGLQEVAGDVTLTQVKEKFGTLRIYWMGEDEHFEGYVDFAAVLSAHICEVCGKPGELRNRKGWVKTVCDEHAEG